MKMLRGCLFLICSFLIFADCAVAQEMATMTTKQPASALVAVKKNTADQKISKGTILFVPLDNRPVCKNYTVDTLRAAGWNVQLPPEEAISAGDHGGNPEILFSWLDAKAPEAISMVVSADALIYGGLVDSRTHHADPQMLLSRANRLLSLKNKTGNPNVYAFVTVMRSPRASSAPVEPAYYKDWGAQIFRRGQLLDKQDLGTLSKNETRELLNLQQLIPAQVQQDIDTRRAVNLKVTKALLQGTGNNKLDYLMVGRDDTSTFSQAHKDARQIESLVRKLPEKKVRFFAGADQLGLILLNRAVNTLTYKTPFVYPFYAEGIGAKTIPSYEDTVIGTTVHEHIVAAGAFPVSEAKQADVCLGIFTPIDGKTMEAGNVKNDGRITVHEENFAYKIKRLLEQGKDVAVADIAFGNGSSTALTKELFQTGIARKFVAYGGWNTASNAMGMALGQGLLAKYMNRTDKLKQLEIRYLEDWGYQAKVRTAVYQELIWPKDLPGSQMPPAVKTEAEAAITVDMLKMTVPVLGNMAAKYNYTLPWARMFEVYVTPK